MSEDTLRALMPVLSDIPAADVDTPDYPVAIAIHEARELLALCQGEVHQRLVSVGVNPEDFERLRLAIDAADEAQTNWVRSRDQAKTSEQIFHEQEGYALRADLLSACRFNLRDERLAMGMLSAIVQDEGPESLIEDLACLSRMIETREAYFDNDMSFDAVEQAQRARALAATIRDGLSRVPLERGQSRSKDLRDRAFTLLDDTVHYIRDAGTYAYRRDARMRLHFASIYQRRLRRRRDAQTPAMTEPRSSSPPI